MNANNRSQKETWNIKVQNITKRRHYMFISTGTRLWQWAKAASYWQMRFSIYRSSYYLFIWLDTSAAPHADPRNLWGPWCDIFWKLIFLVWTETFYLLSKVSGVDVNVSEGDWHEEDETWYKPLRPICASNS